MATPHATPPVAAPKPAAPTRARWQAWWRSQGRTVMRQGLALVVIGGLTAFAWGSLQAWSQQRQQRQLQAQLGQLEPALQAWLSEPVRQLAPLVADATLQLALQTPLGLASPAAARALAQWEGLSLLGEVVLYEPASGRTLGLGAAVAPPAEVLTALQQQTAPLQVLGTGGRNGMVYYAQLLPSLGVRTWWVIHAVSLRQLVPGLAAIPLPETGLLRLELPHLTAPAQWLQEAPLRWQPPVPAVPAQAVLPLPGLPGAQLILQPTGPAPVVGWLPQLLVLLWGLGATLAVLWPHTAPVRQRLHGAVAPLRARWLPPLLALWPRVRPHAPETEGAARAAWQPVAEAGETVSLVGGPGDYSAADFRSAQAAPAPNRPRLKRGPPPAAAGGAQASSSPYNPTDPQLLKQRVRRCIRQGLLELLYQPLYHCQSGKVEANELLARLRDEQGVIAPGEFMPVLSQLGSMAALDNLVFAKVMEEHFGHDNAPPVTLNLNISGTTLDDLSYLRDVAKRGPAVLKKLVFEVRSSEVVRDPNALQLLKALQRQGARVAVDYFGGGRAMVEATKALGIDYLKCDITLLTATKERAQDFTEVCAQAERLGLPVVVEKIEDAEKEAMARRLGAQLLQGYGLGKPGPALVTLPRAAKL